MIDPHQLRCPACQSDSRLLDVVDFNKSCEELRGRFLEQSGRPVYYAICGNCDFCHAPELYTWPLEEFERQIYNAGYVDVDPDYADARPRGNAAMLIGTFGSQARSIRHLDYGGGDGLLSKLMGEAGFASRSHDPFVNKDVALDALGQFDLVSAMEVFEHVPDVHALMRNLQSLLRPDGLVLFTTLVSDGNIVRNQRLNWWYAAPRNGHISLFSRRSLALLAAAYGYQFASVNAGVHFLWRAVPPWARHLFKEA